MAQFSSPSFSSPGFADTKPHYHILDGLRGVAALTVVWFHIFEAFATSHLDQQINHGYLAVDFFFILSGFVMGYAYDDRWKTMKVKEFFWRRLIRLHPMVVMGTLLSHYVLLVAALPGTFQKFLWLCCSCNTVISALFIPATP